jgi:hypothetical protein
MFRNAIRCIAASVLFTPAAVEAADTAAGAALRADVLAALAELSKVPSSAFRGEDLFFRVCMHRRFDRRAPPDTLASVDDPVVLDAIRLYERYWWHALRARGETATQDRRLGVRLAALLNQPPPRDDEAMTALQDRLGDALRERGFHSLRGRTPPLHELFVWRTQEERDFDVVLPGGESQRVRVYLMEDFIGRGWSDYATCGRRSAGGWAKPEGLYAVRESYGDLAGEKFRVTFLGHEAQHFADLKRWPKMPSWLLEYRAKLVEIAWGDETRRDILRRFYESQGDDAVRAPHAFANRKVIADLRARLHADLREVDPALLRRSAAEILIEDTRSRLGAGPTGQ